LVKRLLTRIGLSEYDIGLGNFKLEFAATQRDVCLKAATASSGTGAAPSVRSSWITMAFGALASIAAAVTIVM
jgi:hypothetical protein